MSNRNCYVAQEKVMKIRVIEKKYEKMDCLSHREINKVRCQQKYT